MAEPETSSSDSGSSPAVSESPDVVGRSPGWREVLLLGFVVVAIVLGLAVLTSVMPAGVQDVVFRTPLTIVVLVVGTVGLMLWIARRPSPRV